MKKIIFLLILFLPILIMCSGTHTFSAENTVWTKLKEVSADKLNDITYGNNCFVTVGDDGMIKTSSDGVHWAPRVAGKNINLKKVIWSGSMFIAVGEQGTILESRDGNLWSTVKSGVQTDLNSVAYNGKTYVIVGKDGTVLHSKDAKKWNTTKTGCKSHINGVIWGHNAFIAVGSPGIVLSSEDGIKWVIIHSSNGYGMNNVAYNGKVYVAITGPGPTYEVAGPQTISTIMTSKDGTQWTAQTFEDYALLNVFWYGNRFLAVGGSGVERYNVKPYGPGRIFTSTDGLKWQESNLIGLHEVNSVVWNGKKFISVGSQSSIYQSSDAKNWSAVQKEGLCSLQSVVSNGRMFAAVGGNKIYTSKDGLKWEGIEPLEDKRFIYKKIIWAGNRFVAVGNDTFSTLDGIVVSSPDGIHWTSSLIKRQVPNDIVWNGKLFLSVGSDETILVSSDSIEWKEIHFKGQNNRNVISRIIWNGKAFVAFTSNKQILVSRDTQNWTRCDTTFQGTVVDCLWDGSKALAIGNTSKYEGDPKGKFHLITSENGINWTETRFNFPEVLTFITTCHKGYITGGKSGSLYQSKDGKNWNKLNTGTRNNLNSSAGMGSKLVAVGENGTVIYRDDKYDTANKASWYKPYNPPVDTSVTWSVYESDCKNFSYPSVAWNGKTFAAADDASKPNTVFLSQDGKEWTEVELKEIREKWLKAQAEGSENVGYIPKSIWFSKIIWADNQFFMVGHANEKETTVGYIATSKDGTHWNVRESMINQRVNDVIWNGKVYAALGYVDNHACVITSSDGIDWTFTELEDTYYVSSLVWSGSRFILAPKEIQASGSYPIYTSLDGFKWRKEKAFQSFNSMVWNGRICVGVGNEGAIYTSYDGVQWTKQPCPTVSNLNSVVWNGHQLIAVGDQGTILTSLDGENWKSCKSQIKQRICKIIWNGRMLLAFTESKHILIGTIKNLPN